MRIDGFAAEERAIVSPLSGDYYHGGLSPVDSPIHERASDDYVLERASLSSILIARATDVLVTDDSSELGYRFRPKVPGKVKRLDQLQQWVESEGHSVLDELVKTDDHLDAIARRYEHLVMPIVASRPSARRSGIMFKQAISEPRAWLEVGSSIATYHGLRIGRHQALAFASGKLSDMQISARRDMARQDIRSAIHMATEAMGTMLTPENPEAKLRHEVLKSFVYLYTGHQVMTTSFGDLYEVEPDNTLGVAIRERTEGFGIIQPNREMPVACPASYRFAETPEDIAKQPSALFKLLRAGINSMKQNDLYAETLVGRRTSVPNAVAILNTELSIAGKPLLRLVA